MSRLQSQLRSLQDEEIRLKTLLDEQEKKLKELAGDEDPQTLLRKLKKRVEKHEQRIEEALRSFRDIYGDYLPGHR